MTKRLAPERIAEIWQRDSLIAPPFEGGPGHAALRAAFQDRHELLDHIDGIEAELRDRDVLLRNENENYRRCAEELAEAKAEISVLCAKLYMVEQRAEFAEARVQELKTVLSEIIRRGGG